jgi:hypothetical protein
MCKSRKIPGYTLAGTSAVTLLAGIVMVGLSVAFYKSNFLKSVDAIPDLVHKIVFFILLAGALLAVLTGACGVFVGMKPVKGFCNCSLGFLQLWSYLILIILGVILISLSSFTKLSVDTFCGVKNGAVSIGGVSVSVPKFGRSMDDLFDDINKKSYGYRNEMCTSMCPCKTPTENPWAELTEKEASDDYQRSYRFTFSPEATIETTKQCIEKL